MANSAGGPTGAGPGSARARATSRQFTARAVAFLRPALAELGAS